MIGEIKCHAGYLEAKLRGDADIGELKDLAEHLLSERIWVSGTIILADISELNTAPLKIHEMLSLKSWIGRSKAKLEHSRIAIVVARDLEFGMARMLMALVESEIEIISEIFRSKDKAMSWLRNEPQMGLSDREHVRDYKRRTAGVRETPSRRN